MYIMVYYSVMSKCKFCRVAAFNDFLHSYVTMVTAHHVHVVVL